MKHLYCTHKFILLCLLILSPHITYAKTWLWSEESVDPQPGKFTSVAIDQSGNIHLVYSSDAGAFQYGFRPAGESKWYTMPLESGTGFPNIKPGTCSRGGYGRSWGVMSDIWTSSA